MDRRQLERRTRRFNVDVIRVCRQLPRDPAGWEIAKQLIRSSGSVGANHRASGRAKSRADFIYKIEVVLEEADESLYWLEVIREAELYVGPELERLIAEANELTAIFTATSKSAKANASNI
ncbi:four helix bundle protein [Flaviaesturariibacter flavus]|uniref:Four helix bundle protein n=1 Tax=Flaviaesturariibacter flavus TaxID=2502780 RepID=A0A4R1BBE2_9BACT|nr:four helix bundle protein [Flaviaesturariibacter flavus]TCJ14325.1 four helix bundle protein [Flaviaesturariibacter flavus]